MNTKQLTYPTIQEQKQFWINKEAQSGCCRTNETREVKLEEITKALSQYHHALDTRQHGDVAANIFVTTVETILDKPWIGFATIRVASNPQREVSTTADPKPEDFGGNELPDRIEANEDYWSLRDEGRNPDGSGESYAGRNA